MAASFSLRLPEAVIFGSGTMAQLPKEAASRGRRPLIVIGGGSARQSGLLDRVRAGLVEAGLEPAVFEGVEPDPSLETVERGRAEYRRHECDLVIALGGGSVLDVGKAIGALARADEPVATFFSGQECPAAGAPIIAMPTTAGTGAEVTPNSVISDPAQRRKASIRGRSLLPTIALVDPELTLSLPPEPTAHTGLDAFTQAIESYVSVGASPATDALALESLRHIAPSLRRAVEDGMDLAAREDMALGSLLAGIALASARLGLVHGLAHPLGELYHLPHGFVCGLLLPYVMEFNLEVARGKLDRAAGEIGVEGGAEGLLAWTVRLCRDLGVGHPLAERGASRDDYPAIIRDTLASGSTKRNPRAPTEQDVVRLLDQVLAGAMWR